MRAASCRTRLSSPSASNWYPTAPSSIESAITSLLISEAFIPSCPIPIASLTAMVLNSSGVPPASRDPVLHLLGQLSQVVVAGLRLDPRVGDPDDGPLEILVGQPDRPEHRPLRSPLNASGQSVAHFPRHSNICGQHKSDVYKQSAETGKRRTAAIDIAHGRAIISRCDSSPGVWRYFAGYTQRYWIAECWTDRQTG